MNDGFAFLYANLAFFAPSRPDFAELHDWACNIGRVRLLIFGSAAPGFSFP